MMQLNISTLESLGHLMINGIITKQLIPNLYSYNFYIKSKIKQKDLKGSELFWFPFSNQLVLNVVIHSW